MWGPRVRSGKKKKKREAEAVLGSKRRGPARFSPRNGSSACPAGRSARAAALWVSLAQLKEMATAWEGGSRTGLARVCGLTGWFTGSPESQLGDLGFLPLARLSRRRRRQARLQAAMARSETRSGRLWFGRWWGSGGQEACSGGSTVGLGGAGNTTLAFPRLGQS
jgi:hypothetical protein